MLTLRRSLERSNTRAAHLAAKHGQGGAGAHRSILVSALLSAASKFFG